MDQDEVEIEYDSDGVSQRLEEEEQKRVEALLEKMEVIRTKSNWLRSALNELQSSEPLSKSEADHLMVFFDSLKEELEFKDKALDQDSLQSVDELLKKILLFIRTHSVPVQIKPKGGGPKVKRNLKSIWRHLSKLTHPDLATNDHQRSLFEKQMAKVNAAYSSKDLATLLELLKEMDPSQFDSDSGSADVNVNFHISGSRICQRIDDIFTGLRQAHTELKHSASYKYKQEFGCLHALALGFLGPFLAYFCCCFPFEWLFGFEIPEQFKDGFVNFWWSWFGVPFAILLSFGLFFLVRYGERCSAERKQEAYFESLKQEESSP